jgi:uncharacterized membrane protein
MKSRIAIKLLLCLICVVTIFHLSILARIVPYNIAWGGQLHSDNEMYVFETVSIIINLFFGFVLLIKGGYIKSHFKQQAVNIILWVFLILFTLNTIGNLFAKSSFEKLFSILTLISAVLIWTILKDKKIENVDSTRNTSS